MQQLYRLRYNCCEDRHPHTPIYTHTTGCKPLKLGLKTLNVTLKIFRIYSIRHEDGLINTALSGGDHIQ
jgi:hypothetical protein